MNADILSGGQHHSVAYAMERLVQSLRTGMEKGGALALPKLLAWQPHGYE
jgi:CRISPR-associated protein Cas1